jgi:hypothetical protein
MVARRERCTSITRPHLKCGLRTWGWIPTRLPTTKSRRTVFLLPVSGLNGIATVLDRIAKSVNPEALSFHAQKKDAHHLWTRNSKLPSRVLDWTIGSIPVTLTVGPCPIPSTSDAPRVRKFSSTAPNLHLINALTNLSKELEMSSFQLLIPTQEAMQGATHPVVYWPSEIGLIPLPNICLQTHRLVNPISWFIYISDEYCCAG